MQTWLLALTDMSESKHPKGAVGIFNHHSNDTSLPLDKNITVGQLFSRTPDYNQFKILSVYATLRMVVTTNQQDMWR